MTPQVGDYVYISGLHMSERIDTITKVTKTQVKVASGTRFSINTTRSIGSGSRWQRCYFTVITPEKAEALKREWQETQDKARLVKKLRDFRWQDESLENLQRLTALMGIE